MEGKKFDTVKYSGPCELESGENTNCDLKVLINPDKELLEIKHDQIMSKMVNEHSGVQNN